MLQAEGLDGEDLMTYLWLMIAASFGFLAGVLTMSLLRMAALEPPTADSTLNPGIGTR